MNRILGLVFVFVCLALPAFAQVAPNRAAEVAQITRVHPEIFGSDETRANGLKIIVCGLNQQDNGNWGRLVKLDQGGRIPADHIVWRPTREHFDVLTDDSPMWGESGVIQNPQWQWSPVDCGAPAPQPQPVPPVVPAPGQQPAPQVPNVDYTGLLQQILASQIELLSVSKDTNDHVKNMDKTIGETLGSVSKFAGKYIMPAVAAWFTAKQLEKK